MARNPVTSEAPVGTVFQVFTTEGQETVIVEPGTGGGGGIPIPTTSLFIFVSPPPGGGGWGDDTTGDGTMTAPYATINHALGTITSSALNKIWDIVLFPGDYTEDISVPPYVRIVGFDPSDFDQSLTPARIDGTIQLDAQWNAQAQAIAYITNVTLAGGITIIYPTGEIDGQFSFTNVQFAGDVTVEGLSENLTNFHECTFRNNFTQIGGTVRWYNSGTVEDILHMIIDGHADTTTAFEAIGGGWAGDCHADQNGVTDQDVSLVFNGFTAGLNAVAVARFRITAAGAKCPTVRAGLGDTPENPTLDGSAAAALSTGMRIDDVGTVNSGTVLGSHATTDIVLPLPGDMLGATSIEDMRMTAQPVGAGWVSLIDANQLAVTFAFVQNGTQAEIHCLILNPTDAPVTTAADLAYNFFGYLR